MKKYKEEKIFVTGISGSGKTTFAKKYSDIFNIEYISFNSTWSYQNDTILEYDKMINKYSNSFITDAIPYTVDNEGKLKFLDYYNKNLGNAKIIICFCSDIDELFNRRNKKAEQIEGYISNKEKLIIDFNNFYRITLSNYINLNTDYFDTIYNSYISYDELLKNINKK